ncbi:hypothetical protein D6T63_07470 [Arthrobacter cheniae]|uniref:Uncharacterized protein n=1 Tax=Arthrobacter cheniae TaxID=1258888 RepID=A0A3A5M822_9MICC|nr:hypothetical protein [Arthrobacter cheniae]RJT81017.1 hypothetical protein D6T63_07470 [Arthrobacter cheniae]
MAFGTSGASAAQDPAGAGLVESTTSVVVATIAPTGSHLSAITASLAEATPVAPSPSAVPSVLADIPAIPDVTVQVPQLLSQPAATVLSPVTTAVDQLVAHVPIVQQHVPAGTVTEVTAPVMEAVDGVVGGVTEPVLDVLAPITAPITEVVEVVPVTDVVVPEVVGSVADAVAVPEAPQPAVEPAAPIVVSTPDSATSPAMDDVRLSGAVIAPAFMSARAVADDSVTGAVAFGVQTSLVLRSFDDANLPVLTHLVASSDTGPAPLSGALASFAGVAASMTGGGSSAPIAAIGASALLVVVLFADRGRRAATAGLPTSPSFDPGSSPD